MPANLGRGDDGTVTEILQFDDNSRAGRELLGFFISPSYSRKKPPPEWPPFSITLLKGLCMKLIHTSRSALDAGFQRLHSGRYRRRLRSRRAQGPTPNGTTPKKAA